MLFFLHGNCSAHRHIFVLSFYSLQSAKVFSASESFYNCDICAVFVLLYILISCHVCYNISVSFSSLVLVLIKVLAAFYRSHVPRSRTHLTSDWCIIRIGGHFTIAIPIHLTRLVNRKGSWLAMVCQPWFKLTILFSMTITSSILLKVFYWNNFFFHYFFFLFTFFASFSILSCWDQFQQPYYYWCCSRHHCSACCHSPCCWPR